MKPILKIFLALFTALLFIYIQIQVLEHRNDEIAEMQKTIESLQEENAQLTSTVEAQKQKITELTKELREARMTKSDAQKTSRGGDRLTSLGEYTITAYCACAKCCGKWATNRPGGKVIGAAGVELTPGVSVAAWLPFGTRLLIDGREYVVEDRTAGWIRDKYDGRIIDIYFADHAQALEWGKRTAEVWAVSK